MPLRKTTQRQAAPGPRRRAVLAWPAWAAAVLAAPALAGCADTVPPADLRAARRLAAARGRAADDSAALLARYDATAAAHPALSARLAPLRAQVALHAQAFTAPGPGAGAPSPSGGSAPPGGDRSATPSASAGPVAVPAGRDAALGALAAAEQRVAATRGAALRDAPPELARLLASVAACGAAHALLLSGDAS